MPADISTSISSRTRCTRWCSHHDALRLRFREADGGWQQEYGAAPFSTPIVRVDLSSLPQDARAAAVAKRGSTLQERLDISAGPLLRAAHFDFGSDAAGPAARRDSPSRRRRRLVAHPGRGPRSPRTEPGERRAVQLATADDVVQALVARRSRRTRPRRRISSLGRWQDVSDAEAGRRFRPTTSGARTWRRAHAPSRCRSIAWRRATCCSECPRLRDGDQRRAPCSVGPGTRRLDGTKLVRRRARGSRTRGSLRGRRPVADSRLVHDDLPRPDPRRHGSSRRPRRDEGGAPPGSRPRTELRAAPLSGRRRGAPRACGRAGARPDLQLPGTVRPGRVGVGAVPLRRGVVRVVARPAVASSARPRVDDVRSRRSTRGAVRLQRRAARAGHDRASRRLVRRSVASDRRALHCGHLVAEDAFGLPARRARRGGARPPARGSPIARGCLSALADAASLPRDGRDDLGSGARGMALRVAGSAAGGRAPASMGNAGSAPPRTAYGLRGRFGREPLQVVERAVELPWREVDLRGEPPAVQEQRIRSLLDEERTRGFDLAQAPLLRLVLVRCDEETATSSSGSRTTCTSTGGPGRFSSTSFEPCTARGGGSSLPEVVPYGRYIAWLAGRTGDSEAFWRAALAGVDGANAAHARARRERRAGDGGGDAVAHLRRERRSCARSRGGAT